MGVAAGRRAAAVASFVIGGLLAVVLAVGTALADRAAPDDGAAAGASSATTSPPAPRAGTRPVGATGRFVPERLVLPGGVGAPVRTAATVDGVLRLPEDVGEVGWWDGGAQPGDPFGTSVVAGHVDGDGQVGTLAAIIDLPAGAEVRLEGDDAQARYRVTGSELVGKEALATSTDAFDQRGPHRLVLITCWGRFVPGEGYDSNYVVVAEPVR